MDKAELKQILRENLTINIREEYDISSKRIRVSIWFEDEELDEETFEVGY